MKTAKKIISVLLSAMLIACLFAGCSSSERLTTEITDDTMIFAYTQENSPFIYKDESGNLAGFDVELVDNTFDSFKGDFKNYAFVQVDEGYLLGEDTCYTDENGKEYSAIVMLGGTQKNVGTANEDYNWSNNIIENNIITVVPSSSAIKTYIDLTGARVAVVSDVAQAALIKNSAISSRFQSSSVFSTADEAFAAVEAGEIDAVVIDDFSFNSFEGKDSYVALNGALDTVEYGFCFAPSNDFSAGFNEAVNEMKSEEYGDGDTLTPLVEKYFGNSDVCVFYYEETK